MAILYQPLMMMMMMMMDECGAFSGMGIGEGELKYSEKTSTIDTLSTTNPT
jgi:hypothetical protein